MGVIIFILLLTISPVVCAATYYVAPAGNDADNGTKDKPWRTWGKAFTSAVPGDTVFFRGGVYPHTVYSGSGYTKINSGIRGDFIYYWAFPGEIPILDADAVIPEGTVNVAIGALTTSFVHFKGLTVRNVWSVHAGVECIGIRTGGTDLIFENCTVNNVHGIGFQSYPGDNTYYLNCDAYNCCDSLAVSPQKPGNRGTGFAVLNTTSRNLKVYYKNCRAWNCGDQGFSTHSVAYVEWDGCWAFQNGQLQGAGNGWKIGFLFHDIESLPLQRVIKNCIACYNRASGFTTNDKNFSVQSMNFYNNTAYHNGYYPGWGTSVYGFFIYDTEDSPEKELIRVFRNNISYGNEDGAVYLGSGAFYRHDHNSWDMKPAKVITDSDFESTDSTGISGPRKADGSLPDLDFLKLSSTSDLIDAGVDVGFSYFGLAPDLGAHEFDNGSLPFHGKLDFKVYPNPAKEFFTIRIENTSLVPEFVQLIDSLGSVVLCEKLNPDMKEFALSFNLKSGVYIVQLISVDSIISSQKLIVHK